MWKPSVLVAAIVLTAPAQSVQRLPREAWGAPDVTVSNAAGQWLMKGRRTHVTLNGTDLAVRIEAGAVRWNLGASAAGDVIVRHDGRDIALRLADANRIAIARYDTGFKTGVKLTLSRWRHAGSTIDLTLFMTLALEGIDEELAFDVAAHEGNAVVRQLDWPAAVEPRDVECHDQYRDYYVDAPSYDPQFAIHEEDESAPPVAFPGTRFGISKEGRIPFMRYWDGGKQTFLNSRFMLGHLRKNYQLLFNRYHDAIITPYAPSDLHGFVNGGVPQVGLGDLDKSHDRVRDMAALHQRIALLEMTNHEFLDPSRRRERATFADGTTVTVDWDAGTFAIKP